MLNNLRLVLLQHKKFLATFFLVVFLPSIVLAFFGIRAIRNERYKLQQLNLERQKGFVRALMAEVQSLIEKESAGLREISTSRAMIEGDDRSLSELVSRRLQEKSVLGRIVAWNQSEPAWFPGPQAQPPPPRPPEVPADWKRFQADLAKAEWAEFRLGNFNEAISSYGQILQRARDATVKAWIKSRIARCQAKQKDFELAIKTYLSIIEEFPRSITESGRPLEIACRMEMLDALRADRNYEAFFRESLQTLKNLEQNFWSTNGDQVRLYETLLHEMMDEVLRDNPSDLLPEGYKSSVEDIRNSLDRKLEIWGMAEAVRRNLLPGIRNKLGNLTREGLGVQKNVLDFEEKDILVLLLPVNRQKSGRADEFIGSLLQVGDLKESLDTQIAENSPPGISILFRSTLSERVLYGREKTAGQVSAFIDFFPENFPPWKVEVFQAGGLGGGIALTKNIFFWTILALLVIVFLGSGLIVRTLVQEVNLLNMKSDFIASVSHEFKTPLTAMGAILERLLSNEVEDPKKIREYYKILSHDSNRLKRLVKNVLDFTKIEDGKREYKFEAVDIGQLVRQEVDSFQKETALAGFRVEARIDDDIPPLLADEEALRQALHNILDNAAKFSGREKKIDVTVFRRQDRVEMAVEDRGIGIPESEQKKVFEKFYRGRQASSVSPTGTGLGLTLVKHIVDAHGGDVAIKSQPGKGSRIVLTLPLGKGG